MSVDLLIDTGSVVSLISGELYDLVYAKQTFELRVYPQEINYVDGGLLKVRGSVTLPIQVGNSIFQQEVVVVEEVTAQAILGLNCLQAYNGVVDVAKKGMRLAGRYYNLISEC